MDIVQARIDILNWITSFVERPHPLLDDWAPCPYARRARLDSKISIREGKLDPYADLMHAELDGLSVICWVYDRELMTSSDFFAQVRSVNQGFLVPRDLIALGDHPDSPEIVNDVCMNQGTYALVFLQCLSELNSMSKNLAPKGYYYRWSESYLTDLFEFRQDPRT